MTFGDQNHCPGVSGPNWNRFLNSLSISTKPEVVFSIENGGQAQIASRWLRVYCLVSTSGLVRNDFQRPEVLVALSRTSHPRISSTAYFYF